MASHLPRNEITIIALKKRYSGKFLIGHIGALAPTHKGQLSLIEAARILQPLYPEMHFLLLGSGRDESFFRTEAAGLTNMEFLGFQENVGDYLAIFDLFAFPSLEEGLGSTLLDAMEFGVPIVASNVGGIPDIIIDQQNGLLFPPTDSRVLSEQIKKLYHNPDLRKILSENSQKMVRKFSRRLSVNVIISSIMTFWERNTWKVRNKLRIKRKDDFPRCHNAAIIT